MISKFYFNKKKLLIGCLFIFGALIGIMIGTFMALFHDLPQIQSLETFKPSAITRIYSADKVLLSELFVEKRDPVPLKVIPENLKAAVLVTEDRNFYHHSGIDLKGILRAIVRDVRAGKFIEGASTITQQLSKTLFLTSRKTLLRKIKEAFLAFQIERRYTKNEILELYLNQIYFGSGAYGVESAARIYFDKSVKDLDLAECALLAGLPKAPTRYSPLINKNRSLKRRNIVLKQMKEAGIIRETDYNQSRKKPIHLKTENHNLIKARYFVNYIKNFLENTLGSDRLYKSGLTIVTTLDYKMQKIAELAVNKGCSLLKKRMVRHGIKNPDPQAALVSLDVQTGGILAMVGGENFVQTPFNRSTDAKRQPGSAFKPILYADAIEHGFPQSKTLLDAPVVFEIGNRKWRPNNFSGTYKGEMTFRRALALSENIPAVRLIAMLGPASVSRFGHRMGIESTLHPNFSLALGTSEVKLINLTAAYSVFANKGELIKPYGVIEVFDQKGRQVWHVKPQKKLAMSRAGAAIMTDMLRAAIQEGTGKKAKIIKRSVAGKTGTTNNFKDALFIGFSPSITTGVWVGKDDFTTLGKWETGAKAALPIWIDFMTRALLDKPVQYFDIPDDVIKIRMDLVTGGLASDNSPYGVIGLFKKGTEPTSPW